MAASEQLVGDNAKGIQIGSLGNGQPYQDFGRHVCQRAGRRAGGSRVLLAPDGQAEIQHLHLAVGDEDVARLEVAVDDAAPVEIDKRLQYLEQQVDLDGARLVFAGFQNGLSGFDQFHGEERLALVFKAVVEHADDVGMAQRGKQLELLRQRETQVHAVALGHALPLLGRIGDSFERDGLASEPVGGAIHHAHAARAKLLRQHVAPADDPGCGECVRHHNQRVASLLPGVSYMYHMSGFALRAFSPASVCGACSASRRGSFCARRRCSTPGRIL